MTEASGGVDARPRRWDVALSFAGAQRDYVGQVADALKARGVRCFYDADRQVRLWGSHLAEELPRIYERESAAVVVFISADYAAGDWTRLERRAAFSQAVRQAGIHVLPARFDDSKLPGLVDDVVAVDLGGYTPERFADLVVEKLADLRIVSSPASPGRADRRPGGTVQVREADPRRLGVHEVISVPGVADQVLPEYVLRDVDAAEFGVRAKLAAAAQRGGFVLLVGGSSVGKTRSAVEAVKEVLPDWWLRYPAGSAEVAALASAPPPTTVLWLDELQRYLDDEHGLTVAVVRALLNASCPVVIVGTLWPELYTAYTALPAPGAADPHAREREVLDLAAIVRINPEFSPAEQDRAHAAATRDPRLRVALETAGYGLTQTLAAAPQLVARWQDAKTASPYAWAVLTAALDTVRLGARAPLSIDFLRAAAPGYCTSQERAEAPEDWFEQALAYATSKLHGAAATLRPAGTRMGHVAGYIAADYLVQYASRERRYKRVPTSTWDAVLSHIRDPADAGRLADSARNRLLYCYAIPLYRYAADLGDDAAAGWLAELLAERGDLGGLRARADAGDWHATWRLAELLIEQGDLDEAVHVVRVRADAGSGAAAERLAELLIERGDLEEAVHILRAQADAGSGAAAERLAELLIEHEDVDTLRVRADAGDGFAAWHLTRLLAEHGDLDELRTRADAGDRHAAGRLAWLLARRGDLDNLRARADVGDTDSAGWLADLLARRGDLDGLRARADAGDGHAAWRLDELLARHGDLHGLQVRTDAGDGHAAQRLVGLLSDQLIKHGRAEEAEHLRRFGLNPDESIAGK